MSDQAGKRGKLAEVIRFVITGAVCFAVEFVLLVLMKELLHLDTLIATPIAFIGSVVVNYLMCVKWVFQGANGGGAGAQAGFFLTSAVGLLLNELFMLLFRIVWGEDAALLTVLGFTVSLYMLNKVIATLLVMIWNYFTKRAIVNRFSRPDGGKNAE